MKIFSNAERSNATRPAILSDKGEKILYSDLGDISDNLTSKVPYRSLVFSLNQNTTGSLCGYYAFLQNGIVPLMLEANIDPELLKNLISTYCPEYLWLPTNDLNKYSKGQVLYSVFDYSLVKLGNCDKYPLHGDLALLLTTSGSTGSPKLVKLTYDNILLNAASISDYLSIDSSEKPITSLPMHYSFGLSIINSHLINGATILLTDSSLMQKEFWSFLKSNDATSLSGIPYSFEMLKKLRFLSMDLPSLKTVTQAGGKLNDELNREFSEYCINSNKRFYVMYGQTEATARMSFLPPEYSIEKLGSMGIAIPGGSFSLIDEERNPIEGHNHVGELVYTGGNVSMGYAICGVDLAKDDENKGVLITGDLAKRDEDGFYYIVGRKKRFIKLYGNRVNLDETERLIKNIVPDCACAGRDDKMLIYFTDNNLKEEIKNYVSSKTRINSRAFEMRYVENIPKNSSGKTIYSKLRV
jgi:long-chain acyl-CoA synthetase